MLSSLNEEKVLDIRDNVTTIILDAEGTLEVAERRGYQDIDPEKWLERMVSFQGRGINFYRIGTMRFPCGTDPVYHKEEGE